MILRQNGTTQLTYMRSSLVKYVNSLDCLCMELRSRSPRSVSSCINLMISPSYETNATDLILWTWGIHPPFTKCAVLDNGPQLLEFVLVALAAHRTVL
jgi:hypothetical protein